MSASVGLDATSGDDFVLEVEVKDAQTKLPINLSGSSARFAVSSFWTGERVITKTVGAGISITKPAEGVMEIYIGAADTSGLDGDYRHELQIKDVALNRSTVMRGTLNIIADDIID